jgi:hypothetical protein
MQSFSGPGQPDEWQNLPVFRPRRLFLFVFAGLIYLD